MCHLSGRSKRGAGGVAVEVVEPQAALERARTERQYHPVPKAGRRVRQVGSLVSCARPP